MANIGKFAALALRMVDVGFIGVNLLRNAVLLNITSESEENIVSVLGLGKAHEDPSGGIVDSNQERTPRRSSFKPIVIATIELYERTDLFPAFAFASMGFSRTLGRPQRGFQKPSPEGLVIDEWKIS